MRSHQRITNFSGGELSPRVLGQVDGQRYPNGCTRLENWIALPYGGAVRRPGSRYDRVSLNQNSRVIDFVLDGDIETSVELFPGGILIQGSSFPAPWTAEVIDEIQYQQDESELILVHDTFAPQALTLNPVSGYSFGPIEFSSEPQGFTIEAQASDGKFTLTFGPGWVNGDTFRLQIGFIEMGLTVYSDVDATLIANMIAGLQAIPLLPPGTTLTVNSVTITGTNPYEVTLDVTQQNAGGTGLSVNQVNSAGTLTRRAGGLEGSPVGGAAWTDARGYPRTVCLHEQRLVFGGTRTFPSTVWGSATTDTRSFVPGPLDTDAYDFRIKGPKGLQIRWLHSDQVMVLGTSAGAYVQSAIPLTPSNVQFSRQNTIPSAHRQAVQVGDDLFYLQAGRKKVRNLLYSENSNKWRTFEVSFAAEHLAALRLRNLTYSLSPLEIIWGTTESGLLVGLSHSRPNEFAAWHVHSTDGYIRSVQSVFNGEDDELYMVVNRGEETNIEVMPLPSNMTVMAQEDGEITRETATDYPVHLDCNQVGARAGINVGDDVQTIDSDGFVTTIPAGSDLSGLTVGLPFKAKLVTTEPEFGNQTGSAQTQPKRWANPEIKLLASALPIVNGERPKSRQSTANYNEANALITDDIPVNGTNYGDGTFEIVADLPLPCHVLGIYGAFRVDSG